MSEQETEKKPTKKAAAKKLDISYGDLGEFYGDDLDSIKKKFELFVKYNKFTRAAYNPRLQAWELYRDNRHVDFIEVNELIKEFNLGFKMIRGQIRKYQKPEKRAYALGVKYE